MDCTSYLEIGADKTKWGMERLSNVGLAKRIALLSCLSRIHRSKKWRRPRCASRGACPAWRTSSGEQGSPGDSARRHLSPPAGSGGPGEGEGGREGARGAPAPGERRFASALRAGLGAAGVLRCARRDGGLSPDLRVFVRVT